MEKGGDMVKEGEYSKSVQFKEVKIGQRFVWENQIFKRVTDGKEKGEDYNARHIKDDGSLGYHDQFPDDDLVLVGGENEEIVSGSITPLIGIGK
ncbi:hypothetical protein KKD19_05835 [Patescibacteria group bacterium]|nr:hypothetical protein [Patescibacteria group bacterium]MBU4512724.1 hypothetical protein [Patescibacteria group bacterium]